MRRQTVTVGSQTSSAAIPVDYRAQVFNIGIGCVISGGATLTYKIQYTYDDIFDSTVTPTWFDHAVITGQTGNKDSTITSPVSAVRLTVTAYTGGNVTATLLQASGQG